MPSPSPPKTPRLLPWLVLAAACPPALCGLVLAVVRPADVSWGLASYLLGVWILLSLLAWRADRSAARAVLAAMPLVALSWPEVGLRAVGFRFDHAMTIQFGFPPPEMLVQIPQDPELFWKLPVTFPGANSLGFMGPEFAIPKPSGTYRMVFFGDSCTMQSYPNYPTLVQRELARDGDRTFESINLGIAGYTSHQGVVLARRWTERLQADLVVVFFGWNDHWLAYGAPDAERTPQASERPWRDAVRESRIAQWFASGHKSTPLSIPRVSRAEYQANLATIGDIAEGVGARVLLLTAPTSHGRIGDLGWLVGKYAADEQSVVQWHREYNEVLREVARQRRWRLLDLAAEVPDARLAEFLMTDGIHFTDPGLAWVAERIASEVRNLLREEPADRSVLGR